MKERQLIEPELDEVAVSAIQKQLSDIRKQLENVDAVFTMFNVFLIQQFPEILEDKGIVQWFKQNTDPTEDAEFTETE